MNRNLLWLCILLTGPGWGLSAKAETRDGLVPDVSLYSESSYASDSGDFVSQNRLKMSFLDQSFKARPYAALLFDQDSLSNQTDIYNDNSVSAAAGVEARPLPLPIAAFAEARRVFHVVNRADSQAPSESDFRLGGYGYEWFELAGVKRGVQLFDEIYADAAYIYRQDGNIAIQGWNKLGLRHELARRIWADAFMQAGMQSNSIDAYGPRSGELGGGLRLTAAVDNLSVSLQGRRAFDLISNRALVGPRWVSVLAIAGEF